jgi:predicted secreted protein
VQIFETLILAALTLAAVAAAGPGLAQSNAPDAQQHRTRLAQGDWASGTVCGNQHDL